MPDLAGGGAFASSACLNNVGRLDVSAGGAAGALTAAASFRCTQLRLELPDRVLEIRSVTHWLPLPALPIRRRSESKFAAQDF